MKNKNVPMLVLIILVILVTACNGQANNGNKNGELHASGRISVLQVDVAPEVGGIVSEINFEEGDSVMEGDVLFRIDDTLLQTQHRQAVAMVSVAKAGVDSAKTQLLSAELQLEITLQGVRQQKQLTSDFSWQEVQPDDFNLPDWYFLESENLAAAELEVMDAEKEIGIELENLTAVLDDTRNTDLIAVEQRLAKAQATYQVAEKTLGEAQNALIYGDLVNIAQDLFDGASTELDAAQSEYDRILTTPAAKDVLEARSRVAVAQRRLENARSHLTQLQTGEQSLLVESAQAAVAMVATVTAQAEANLQQAQIALEVLEIQLDKFVVKAPVDGTVLSRNLEVGELIAPGGVAIVIGQLSEVHLIVYISEDKYGQIQLGQSAIITVDSFAGETFDGHVIKIADEAEFTPRNVQTVEGRLATVYAVEILVPNSNLELKPGMPADIVINIP